MIVDIGDTLRNHGWKIFISTVSVIGTTIGGAYWSLDKRQSSLEDSQIMIEKNISEINGKMDVVITLLRGRK
ncbi:hypothetical protein [Tautonia marina]|uniref:hypothetical protein n=1 Tax=Tautonia marina TaxID=2653855 RepID=UPI001260D1D8|nr:hypothetical protein [Tautonia marina]